MSTLLAGRLPLSGTQAKAPDLVDSEETRRRARKALAGLKSSGAVMTNPIGQGQGRSLLTGGGTI